jgi:ELWxxDGT repeat protein
MRRLLLALLFCAAAAPLHAQTATLARDIDPRELQDSSAPSQLVALGGKVFFSSGDELWVSDGTSTGTELLADACPGPCSSQPSLLGTVGGILLWTAEGDEARGLWRSDGTRAGTYPLPGPGGVFNVQVVSDHLLIFMGCSAAEGCELWASDGTPPGTRLVKDFTPGPADSNLFLATRGGRTFAILSDPHGDKSLWATDGTEAGTVLVKDFGIGGFEGLAIAGNHLFIDFSTPAEGLEL